MSTVTAAGAYVHVVERGEGEPVVFLHGNPDFGDVWAPVISRLAGRYRCLAPDLPGFGRSAPLGTSDIAQYDLSRFDFSLAGLSRFVAELLDALDLREPVALVGHDFGGIFACAFAAEHGDRLRRLALMNTAFQPDFRWHFWARVWRTPLLGELSMALQNRAAFVRELRRGSKGLPVKYAERAYAMFTPQVRRTVLRLYRATPASAFRGWDERLLATTGRVPTLVVWGDLDPYVEVGRAERFGGRVHHLPDTGHWPMVERPDEVARLLGEFLT